ncbi:beta-ketoacyl-ACP synthase III [Parachitinimonas caeni]|uniref:Beta-ketoacyl-ACP synthase III n=1 Tax=Parachitinimonas caeni TaxID=3031301 RepID=A0ABT7DVB8_9NEIS|nr:beta-ketoacyl-ACP synthase III [Parachitinimonas caeni]MDK2123988.1 beta-ketoacyl-ACP synthase III [Parachitinimonas caeni]
MLPIVVISGTGLYTPPCTITNQELVESYNRYVADFNLMRAADIASGSLEPLQESSVEFIEKASGIKQRHVVDKAGVLDPKRMAPSIPERTNDELSLMAEMAVAAARQALDNAGCSPEEIDAVICAASNMQRPYPAISIEIQKALGIGGYAFDMNVACSSATFGIEQAANAIKAGTARRVLVINPEICSGHLDWRDRDCHFIFGDVCTALVLERADLARRPGFEVLGTKLATQFSNNIRNNFGFLNRGDEAGIGKRDKLFVQEGRKVFKEVCPMVAEHIAGHLQGIDKNPESVSRFWLHQANLNMNQLIARKLLGRDPEPAEAPVILDQFANTSSAGSIIAFHLHRADLTAGEVGVICSFGAGYSVGSVIVRKR